MIPLADSLFKKSKVSANAGDEPSQQNKKTHRKDGHFLMRMLLEVNKGMDLPMCWVRNVTRSWVVGNIAFGPILANAPLAPRLVTLARGRRSALTLPLVNQAGNNLAAIYV
jgi:hypothetical protein